MIYTIKIDQTSQQAQSVVNMLKALSVYDFLQIYETDAIGSTSLTAEQEKELDRRFEYVLQNPTVGKSWDEVEQNLLSK